MQPHGYTAWVRKFVDKKNDPPKNRYKNVYVIFEKSITKNTGLQPKRIYNLITAMGFSAMFTF